MFEEAVQASGDVVNLRNVLLNPWLQGFYGPQRQTSHFTSGVCLFHCRFNHCVFFFCLFYLMMQLLTLTDLRHRTLFSSFFLIWHHVVKEVRENPHTRGRTIQTPGGGKKRTSSCTAGAKKPQPPRLGPISGAAVTEAYF